MLLFLILYTHPIFTMENNSEILNGENKNEDLSSEYFTQKVFLSILAIILGLLSCLGAAGIIWYEKFGSDSKRIFVNKIVSAVCWLTLIWYLTVMPTDILLQFYSPLPEHLCFAFLYWKMILVTHFVLFLDAIIIVRYLLIFWIRNPENFQDNFGVVHTISWISVYRFVS